MFCIFGRLLNPRTRNVKCAFYSVFVEYFDKRLVKLCSVVIAECDGFWLSTRKAHKSVAVFHSFISSYSFFSYLYNFSKKFVSVTLLSSITKVLILFGLNSAVNFIPNNSKSAIVFLFSASYYLRTHAS